MRGRTNITQRAVPYVNGDVIEAEVETGVVNVGDFVEYKTVTDVTPDTGSEFNFYNRQEEILGDYKILKYHNDTSNNVVLELYSLLNGELLDSITFTSGTNFYSSFTIKNGNIILANVYSGLHLIRIINGRFSVINSISYPSVSGTLGSVCFLTDDKFILCFMSYNNSSVAYFKLYEIVSDEISFVKNTSVSCYSQYYGYNFYAMSPEFGKLFFFFEDKTQNSYVPRNILCYRYEYDAEYNFSSLSTVTISLPSNNCGGGRDGAFVKLNNNVVAYSASPTYGSSNVAQNQAFMLIKYNAQTETVSSVVSTLLKPVYFPDVQNEQLNPSKYRYFITSLVSENIMLFMFAKVKGANGYFDYAISLVKYNPNNNEVTYGDPIILGLPENSGKGRVCIKYQDILKIKYVGTNGSYVDSAYIKRFQYVSESILEFVDKNYVKQYAGNNAIGFAKTSGTAGEDVRIYVPHQS